MVPGPASRSYGIAVARLAGVPEEVVGRARDLLRELEEGRGTEVRVPGARPVDTAGQLDLFSGAGGDLARDLAELDVDQMTPLEALAKLAEFRERVRRG